MRISGEHPQEGGITRRNALQRGAVGVAGVGALGLSACGGDDDNGGKSTTAAKAPKQKRGGTLKAGVGGGGPPSLDPHLGLLTYGNAARAFQLYERLATYNPVTYKVEPRLAEEISSDATATSWTVRLRDGLEFHNGKT